MHVCYSGALSYHVGGVAMRREFHFSTALVVKGADYLRVRFWARPSDQLQLVSEAGTFTEKYKADADVILIVAGEAGKPELPTFPEGTQLFEGPGIEFVFIGKFETEVKDGGLHIVVEKAEVDLMRAEGLPFDPELLTKAHTFNMFGDVTSDDHPPHTPPPPTPWQQN